MVFLLETYTYLQVLLNLEFDHLSSFENPHVGRNSHLVEWCSMQCIKLLLSASLKAISKLIKKKKKAIKYNKLSSAYLHLRALWNLSRGAIPLLNGMYAF